MTVMNDKRALVMEGVGHEPRNWEASGGWKKQVNGLPPRASDFILVRLRWAANLQSGRKIHFCCVKPTSVW